MYAGREEIQTYLKACVSRYGLEPYIRVNTAMQQAVWDEAAALWRVTAANGTIFTARVLVSAVGALHVPAFPQIKGLEKFSGPAFHSPEWDASVQLQAKRIAAIGTRATALPFVPEIPPQPPRLFVFHPTPPCTLA